jgi:predicted metal-dependent hydrolase
VRSKRKSLSITVSPDARVLVKAPLEAKDEKIQQIVTKKARWIVKKLDYFDLKLKSKLPERQFISGETHYYLGRAYRLKLNKSSENSVQLKNGRIILNVTDLHSLDLKRTIYEDWLRERAEQKFKERFELCLMKISHWKVQTPILITKKMTRRWAYVST